MGKKTEARRGLTFRERRELGLTFRNILRVTKQLQENGELEDLTQAEIAAEVMAVIAEENPKSFAEASLDWDGILNFIERLLPIILKLIELFGA